MPRLQTLNVKLVTGKRGAPQLPGYEINGFDLEFEQVKGGTGPGETLEASGSPQSFPHSLSLLGPAAGEWDIDQLEVSYELSSGEPYSVRLGSVTLDADTKLNLWYERPAQLLDV